MANMLSSFMLFVFLRLAPVSTLYTCPTAISLSVDVCFLCVLWCGHVFLYELNAISTTIAIAIADGAGTQFIYTMPVMIHQHVSPSTQFNWALFCSTHLSLTSPFPFFCEFLFASLRILFVCLMLFRTIDSILFLFVSIFCAFSHFFRPFVRSFFHFFTNILYCFLQLNFAELLFSCINDGIWRKTERTQKHKHERTEITKTEGQQLHQLISKYSSCTTFEESNRRENEKNSKR